MKKHSPTNFLLFLPSTSLAPSPPGYTSHTDRKCNSFHLPSCWLWSSFSCQTCTSACSYSAYAGLYAGKKHGKNNNNGLKIEVQFSAFHRFLLILPPKCKCSGAGAEHTRHVSVRGGRSLFFTCLYWNWNYYGRQLALLPQPQLAVHLWFLQNHPQPAAPSHLS